MSHHARSTTYLGLSAVVLAALALWLATKGPAPARAEMVATVGSVTAMTLAAGSQDVLLVMDARAEQLLVYRVQNQQAVELFARYSVPRLFIDARGRSGAARPTPAPRPGTGVR